MSGEKSKIVYKLGEINFKSRRGEKYKKLTGKTNNSTTNLLDEKFSDLNRPKLIDELVKKRTNAYKSVLEFPFNMNRVRILSEQKEIDQTNTKCVLYWSSRAQRVQGLFYLRSLSR
jgi:hypothetical protein